MKPLKHRIGFWLLVSVAAAIVVGIVSFFLSVSIFALSPSFDEPTPGIRLALLVIPAIFWIIVALPTGLVMLIWGNVEYNAAFRQARRYAELNGWQAISRTAWRNLKQNGRATFAVDPSSVNRTYILTIQARENMVVDGFESAFWGMSFGDWLWQQVAATGRELSRAVVEEKKAEWEDVRRPATASRYG